MLTMLKMNANDESKIKNLEEKKKCEENELQVELAEQKQKELANIKSNYNT
jgi:hypothetical protein